ncbi:SRPBCC domain-containing protein [Jeotgalibacillus sp. S-D1]|uniref:SRPBCC family protein n=1 Tax=Jeotgalibacillus sp. S-D1 TaxID=2552189 RepID=UPI001059AC56|nr:SRPBCC domain-containing protein [Jeotgalibacillus sp. S-D1]TDL31095.1 SRPBCC domain-containing protein [Jeotgalibacillus sp. S-D1]
MKTLTEGNKLITEHTFSVSQERLFQAYTNSEELEAWWGPEGWQTENKRFEFKPGGYWHYCMKCEDKSQGDFYGMESWGLGKFKEIHAPEKFLYLDTFSDQEGNVNPEMPEMEIEVSFIPAEGATNVVTITTFDSAETLEKMSEMGMIEGYNSQMKRLETYLNQ